MMISVLLSDAALKLSKTGIQDPAFEAGLLLSWVLDKPQSYLYAHGEDQVTNNHADRFLKLIERRCLGEPVAYLTGECEFMSLKFKVSPKVLIPRGDTEVLLEAALYALGQRPPFFQQKMPQLTKKGQVKALDIGTGSGCLAVSLAKFASDIQVDAIDISQDALDIARQNAAFHGVLNAIRFVQADFLKTLDFVQEPYDLIVSNPPYIAHWEKDGLDASVKHYEPSLALFAENEGLAFYERMALELPSLLARDGMILTECGYEQASQVSSLFKNAGLDTFNLIDLAGINRVVVGYFPA